MAQGRILIGEASDSESEDGTDARQPTLESKWSPAFTKPSNITVQVPATRRTADREATVIMGEASESSEEEIMTDSSSYRMDSSPMNRSLHFKESTHPSPEKKTTFQYNSLLHRKLRERNAALGKRIAVAARYPYGSMIKEINTISNQLVKSQSEIQDVGPILRQINSNLTKLEEKLDASLDLSKQIPPIKIEIPSGQTIE